MRIRLRLALYGAFVVGLAMLAFGVLLTWLATEGAPRDQDESLALIATDGAASMMRLTADQLAASSPLLQIDPAVSLDAFVTVYLASGSPIYSTAEIAGAPPAMPAYLLVEAADTGAAAEVLRIGEVGLRIQARPFTTADGRPAVVVAGQATEFVEQQLIGLRFVIWAAAIITLIATTIVAWLVSGRALRPLRKLAATTDEIGRTGDLSRRLDPVKAKDEVGALTSSFNETLDRVESSRDRLTISLEAQRRFVADASHELRSPLTTIRSNAGFLRDRPDAGEADPSEAINDIAAEADRMTRLVDDLLVLTEGHSGLEDPQARVDLGLVLGDLERRALRSETRFRLTASPDVVVAGDGQALSRLCWILIDDALRHGGDGMAAELAADDGYAVITVSDRGPGFPPADFERVFERFYRADPSRSPGGSGLGLAIAREITLAHSGHITAGNRDRGGAEVTVWLPLI